MTREPASARLVARFTDVTVLPSLAPALVSRITFGGAPAAEKRTAVRRLRKASAAGERGSCSITTSGLHPPTFPFATGATAALPFAAIERGRARRASAKLGIVASVGSCRNPSTSSLLFTLLSK